MARESQRKPARPSSGRAARACVRFSPHTSELARGHDRGSQLRWQKQRTIFVNPRPSGRTVCAHEPVTIVRCCYGCRPKWTASGRGTFVTTIPSRASRQCSFSAAHAERRCPRAAWRALERRADDEHDTQERASRALEYHACVVFDFLTGPLAASAVVWRMSAQGSSSISVCSRMACTAASKECYRSHEHVVWT